MSAGWVAGSVRARLLARHRLGVDGAHEVAESGSVEAARSLLAASPYARAVARATSVRDAQRAIWATALWDLRVLAGWLPPHGVEVARTFAAFFEIEDFEDLLAARDEDREVPFELGGLATAPTAARASASAPELRQFLRRSMWRDPGTNDPARMLLHLRIEWARRLADIEPAYEWGLGAAALVAVRAFAEHEQPLDAGIVRRIPALGRRSLDAETLPALVSALPPQARWVVEDVERPDDIWRAEARWWQRVDRDGERLLRAARPGLDVAAGALAVRIADAWRATAAFDIASRRGMGREVLDVVA
jgi:hypothetical protein